MHQCRSLRSAATSVFTAHCLVIASFFALHVGLRVLHLLGYKRVFGLSDLFHVDQELSIPNLFSSMTLVAVAAVAAVIASTADPAQKKLRRGWWLVVAATLFVAVDEGTGFHDRLYHHFGALVQGRGVFLVGWILPYMGLLAVTVLLLLPFVQRLPAPTRNRLIVAGVLFAGAALGMEMLESLVLEDALRAGVDASQVPHLPLMMILVTLEEFSEMVAVALALRALLLHLDAEHPRVLLLARQA